MNSLLSLNLEDLRSLFAQEELPRYAADQVFDWVYKKGQLNCEGWSNTSYALKTWVSKQLSLELPQVIWKGNSNDGTQKFLLRLQDQQSIETVLIPGKNRKTLCVSSQVGCALACTFCHTGTMGLTRNLTAAEIIGQYLVVAQSLAAEDKDPRISNIVYMGQGEPLHNFTQVKKATEIFMEPKGLGIGQRKITLSTSGLVPQIEKLMDFPPISLAISLHSARNSVRDQIMPINKIYDLERLFQAIRKIPLKANRRITYEYLLLEGVNDFPEDVDALIKLLPHRESKVNLIPFNEYPESSYKRPSDTKIHWFKDQLLKRGLFCTVRETRGQDILAACGQLKSLKDKPNTWTSNF